MNDAAKSHPRDIAEEDLERALKQSHRPDLLAELVAESRKSFGFHTSHYPHTINYPWVTERLEFLPEGSLILDVGAGVSPIPQVLAGRGMHVDCVDGSRVRREFPVDNSWNEWGFFDYSKLHPNLSAFNCQCHDFKPSKLYDRIYSVSVLAHMPRPDRDEALALMRLWLRPGGRLLLAVDLMPASDFLWNRSEGVEIAAPEKHGTVAGMCRTLESLGLRLTERRILRGVRQSRTDLLFVECVLPFK